MTAMFDPVQRGPARMRANRYQTRHRTKGLSRQPGLPRADAGETLPFDCGEGVWSK